MLLTKTGRGVFQHNRAHSGKAAHAGTSPAAPGRFLSDGFRAIGAVICPSSSTMDGRRENSADQRQRLKDFIVDEIAMLVDAFDWAAREAEIALDRMIQAPIDQHELIKRILYAAGGVPVETAVPVDHAGKRADILFKADNLIVEIKSLASDRRNVISSGR